MLYCLGSGQELLSTATFPALDFIYTYSRPFCALHVFPRLSPATRFRALFAGHMFSRAYHQPPVFARFLLVTCFPRLSPVTHIRALLAGHMFLALIISNRFSCTSCHLSPITNSASQVSMAVFFLLLTPFGSIDD